MKRWCAAAFAILASILLGSCSRQAILIFVNHSGHAIDILQVSRGANRADVLNRSLWETPFQTPARLEDSYSRELSEATWDLENRYWTVVVQAARCRLSFVIPFDAGQTYNSNRDWWAFIGQGRHTGDPTVQLEPDDALYLVSAGAQRALLLDEFRDIQPQGFPVLPRERICTSQNALSD